ncbi:cell wall protein PhiA [Pleomassaria siparia CBS 279.74]|uniref:Cell wall protein PhiA n=1 Tax=Pleomassaria siparia CBS 279.74 TaxID=1314801 RepID=A0A6G1KMP4_9PLEO|nr:cell wall protein PhiA [Pleomassaria siparia CBS 279.74]
MLFQSAILAASAAVSVAALPTVLAAPETFGLITIHSGSAVQNSGVQAARSSLLVNAKSQNASCDAETNTATFVIKDQELLLYAASATPQTIFVDRSGMGQGQVGYVTGAEPLGKNFETKGWAQNSTTGLVFDGHSLVACPGSIDGAWSLWLSGVTANPAGNQNCTGVKLQVVPTSQPIGCLYTQ